jgi:hypothetical protein
MSRSRSPVKGRSSKLVVGQNLQQAWNMIPAPIGRGSPRREMKRSPSRVQLESRRLSQMSGYKPMNTAPSRRSPSRGTKNVATFYDNIYKPPQTAMKQRHKTEKKVQYA